MPIAVQQELQDQVKDVTTRLNRTTTKLEMTQGQLDKGHREIKDLKEAAQVMVIDALLGMASASDDLS